MPELPEVETIRLSLNDHISGKTIRSVEVLEPKQFIGETKKIIGRKVMSVGRKGKVISILLIGDTYISIHLKLTGQVLYAERKDKADFNSVIPMAMTSRMPGPTTRIIIEFHDGSALFYNDLRKFGWVKVTKEPEGPKGVDVLSDEFTKESLQKIVSSTRKPIKILLMDQDKLAGIGNIYANDSLYEAKIHPERPANSLTENETKALYDAITKIIREGLLYRGSSARDEVYIMPDGTKGGYQNHFKVYHREGKTCLRCRTLIKRIKQAGRSSFFCPKCQK